MTTAAALVIPPCSAEAAVLCKKASGAVFVRTACKKKETVVNLTDVGDVDASGVTGVTAGTGLTGGGTSGTVGLAVDPSVVQTRVTGTCAASSAVSAIAGDGTVSCESTVASAWGQIREDASIRNSSPNVDVVAHVGTGQFCVMFSNTIAQNRLEGAVVSLAGSATNGRGFPRVENGQSDFTCTGLAVGITDASGTYVDQRFSFIVP